MAQTNVNKTTITTHEGGPAKVINAEQQLRRSVLACFLWEETFYEDGQSIADRIREGVHAVTPEVAARVAVQARNEYRLRHAPLLVARELARHPKAKGKLVGDTIAEVIQRPDELTEFLAMYEYRPEKLSKQAKRGLALAFPKFDAYQLAKYNRKDRPFKLRDALFLCHAKPKDEAQEKIWKQLIDGTLPPPETWEVGLSTGGDKKETFEELLRQNKLGYMALLRNLRNMFESGVEPELVLARLEDGAAKSKALPFRYVAAARAVPQWERQIDMAMQIALGSMEKLPGATVLVVDVSYSMDSKVSGKSNMSRMDAASALAALVSGISDNCRVLTFSNKIMEVPPRKGMALIDAIEKSQPHGGTYLGEAVSAANTLNYDRIIVITDEQAHDRVPGCKGKGYMINVGAYKNGVGYGVWTHIDGFSEATVRYIQELEKS